MKDIESLMSKHGRITPRRPLSAAFSDRVIAGIQAPQRTLFDRAASASKGFFMHTFTKPLGILGGIAALLVLGGTTFATIKWLQPEAQVDSAQGIVTLSNGDKRFWVDFKNCPAMYQSGTGKFYYQIKSGGSLTPQHLADELVAGCEVRNVSQYFPQVVAPGDKGSLEKNFKPYQTQYFNPELTIESVSASSLTVTTNLNGTTYRHVSVPTDSNATFYFKGEKISRSELKTGDKISAVIHTNSLSQPFSTETLTVDQLDALAKDGLPIGAHIAGGIKSAYSLDDLSKAYADEGKTWTRLQQNKQGDWTPVVPFN